MNRFSILVLSALVILFSSCEEQVPPGLDLGGGGAVADDSTYQASIEVPQDKNVLIEEVTGVACTNCPDGARQLKSIVSQNNDQGIMVAIHGTGFAEPYNESKYDFRTVDGTDIINSLGQPALPAASIDRIPDANGVFYRSKSEWSTILTNRVNNLPTPVNIHLEGNYNVDNNQYELVTRVALTKSYSGKLNLTIYVLEDGIKDYQLDNQVKLQITNMTMFSEIV